MARISILTPEVLKCLIRRFQARKGLFGRAAGSGAGGGGGSGEGDLILYRSWKK